MKQFVMILNGVLFIMAMVIGGVLFWVMPKQTVSNDENRNLATLPTPQTHGVWDGKIFRAFEEYYNDHFPLRDEWVALASTIKSHKSVQNEEFRVITPPPAPITPSPKNEPTTNLAATNAQAGEINGMPTNQDANQETAQGMAQTAAQEATSPEIDETEFSKIKGVVVVHGRVVQNFGGSKATVTGFAELLNAYRKRLPSDTTIYAMMIPAGSDFWLPRQVNDGVMREKQNTETLNSLLDTGIVPVPVYDELNQHKNEYIAYYTDHHWTGLGAYYGYRAFASVAGFAPLELSQMTYVKKDKTFMGSLYKYTRDEALKDHPDTLEYYKIPNHTTVTTYAQGYKNGGKTGLLYAEFGRDYGLFLGGDLPLIHIKSDVATERKIVMIKDSFGNALAPYLAAHYSDVYVVDYRYFKGNVPAMMRDLGIKELLYAHNTFAANSQAAIRLGRQMMN